jgi:hypothetical protein
MRSPREPKALTTQPMKCRSHTNMPEILSKPRRQNRFQAVHFMSARHFDKGQPMQKSMTHHTTHPRQCTNDNKITTYPARSLFAALLIGIGLSGSYIHFSPHRGQDCRSGSCDRSKIRTRQSGLGHNSMQGDPHCGQNGLHSSSVNTPRAQWMFVQRTSCLA